MNKKKRKEKNKIKSIFTFYSIQQNKKNGKKINKNRSINKLTEYD